MNAGGLWKIIVFYRAQQYFRWRMLVFDGRWSMVESGEDCGWFMDNDSISDGECWCLIEDGSVSNG